MRHYLIGKPFIIRTDHGALTWLRNFKSPEGQLARWLEKLQEYQFTIIHRPGLKHSNADALSRIPCRQCGRTDITPVEIITLASTAGGFSVDEIRQLQLDDKIVGQLLRAKEAGQKPTGAYARAQGIEYHRLSQQWDQLTIQNGVLWHHFIHPTQDQSLLQLVTACGTQTNSSTDFGGTTPRNRQRAPRTRENLRSHEREILLARPL